MATTTITQASFQTACAECADAIDSSDWSTAWARFAKAEAINAGLDQRLEDAGSSVTRRDKLEGLKEALEAAEAKISRANDRKRTVQTRVRAR